MHAQQGATSHKTAFFKFRRFVSTGTSDVKANLVELKNRHMPATTGTSQDCTLELGNILIEI
jgi:hypothetical protein